MTKSPHLYGIFGGTFDPVHNGHIHSVLQVADRLSLTQVYLLPSAVPPHRPSPCASADHRLKMVELAVQQHDRLISDDRELRRSSPSYTIDTIASFTQQFPGMRPCLIVGMDAALELDHWYRYSDLLDLCHLIVMYRPGWDLPKQLPPWWQNRLTVAAPTSEMDPAVYILEIEPTEISATQIRERISRNEPVTEFLPASVSDYIELNHLYQTL
ncbi:MAG: nicotinate-nucleotide adenylyltransferase [Pseudomonadota bacterium]